MPCLWEPWQQQLPIATCTDPEEHPLAQPLPLLVLRSEGAIAANGGGRGEQGVEAGERGGAPQFCPVPQQSNSLNNVIAGTSSDALSLGATAASTTKSTCTDPKEHELAQQLPPAALRSESATAVNGGGRGEQVVEAGGGEGGGAPQFCPIPQWSYSLNNAITGMSSVEQPLSPPSPQQQQCQSPPCPSVMEGNGGGRGAGGTTTGGVNANPLHSMMPRNLMTPMLDDEISTASPAMSLPYHRESAINFAVEDQIHIVSYNMSNNNKSDQVTDKEENTKNHETEWADLKMLLWWNSREMVCIQHECMQVVVCCVGGSLYFHLHTSMCSANVQGMIQMSEE